MKCELILHISGYNGPEGRSDQEWILSYTQVFDLPFFPRKGDTFEIDGCSPYCVVCSEYSIDTQCAEVTLDDWNYGLEDMMEAHHDMIKRGWEWLDADGLAMDMPAEKFTSTGGSRKET